MKKTIFLLGVFCIVSFAQPTVLPYSAIQNSAQQSNFDWLLGSWKRTNDQAGLQTFEHWKKIGEEELLGSGYTLKESDTVWQESIRLRKIEDVWNFEVTGQNEEKPTVFKLSKIELESFTCENKANEFPKKIRYAKVEKGLNAVISGDGKVILFQFVKIPEN